MIAASGPGEMVSRVIHNHGGIGHDDETLIRSAPEHFGFAATAGQRSVALPQGWHYTVPDGGINVESQYDFGRSDLADIHLRTIRLDLNGCCGGNTVDGSVVAGIGPYDMVFTYREFKYPTTVPRYEVDVAFISWDGGGVGTYPPEDWLNGGAGWRCACEQEYEYRSWYYNLQWGDFTGP